MSRPTASEAPALPRYTIDCASNEYGTHWNVEGDSDGSLCLYADAQAALDKLTAERDEARAAHDGLAARLDRAVKAAEEVFGADAIRYKLSLFKNGRAMNHFPQHMDGGWFAFQRAEDDAHIGLCDEIVRLREALRAYLGGKP